MSKFHVNPATGQPGACRAQVNCPFGGETDHYATEAEARQAYEDRNASFAKPLRAAATPTDSYLDSDGAREMWARGVKVERFSTPPNFNTVKPLGTARGFMAGALYSDTSWKPAAFTPDGNIAFVDENRSFSGTSVMAPHRWDEESQSWQRLSTGGRNDESLVSHVLSENGYKRTTTGMIGASEVRRLRRELSERGSRRPSSGEVNPSFSNSIRPE